MSAIRLPLLCAFAGGCLSSAILLYVWHADTVAAIPAQKQLARSNELLAAAIAARNSEQPREVADHASPSPSPSPAVHGEPPATADVEGPPATSSAVSDVLTDLETAYRRRLAAAPGADSPVAAERPPAPASEPTNTAPAEPPREVVALAAAPVAAAAPAAAPAPATPVAAAAPPPIAPPAIEPPVPPPPALVAQMDSRPPDIHYGDVNNTYITNVRQGDVYVTQQQIAMMQYMQLLGASSTAGHYGSMAGGHVARGMAAQSPHYRQFPSTLTNPDNPWGLDFAPLNLVH